MAIKSNFVTRYRDQVTNLTLALEALVSLKKEWTVLGYSAGGFAAEDLSQHTDITGQNLADGVNTAQAFDDLGAAGSNAHYTNLFRLVKRK